MATEVILPKVDMVMETGTFVEWLKKEGDPVGKGDPLFVITTDKAAIEVESPAGGILAGATAKPGDVIPVTEVIGYILAPGEALPATPALKTGASLPASPIPAPAAPKPAGPAPAHPAAAHPAASQTGGAVVETAALAGGGGTGKVRASPVARRLAKDLGMDLGQIAGRGPRGRIHKADVLAYQGLAAHGRGLPSQPQPVFERAGTPGAALAPGAQTFNGQPFPLPDARRKQVVPLSGPRKIIAGRMSASAFTAPHINLSVRVDMSEAMRLRERVMEPLKAQTGQRVSFTAILARAAAAVLPRHPYLNASLSEGNIILWEDVHLGIATSVDENLIVPVIREAQNLNLGQMVAALAGLTERARNRRLTPAEMTGSTFTISNLGMYGIESFTAIINPPEAAILAVGKLVDTPVRSGDGFEFRPMIQLTVSADHRILDGVVVARFLDELKATLENPYVMI